MRWYAIATSDARRRHVGSRSRLLSMQIKELEEALGGVLIERGARQVRLTRFGEGFTQRVRDILRSVDELGDFARASQDRLVGRLRIGMIRRLHPIYCPRSSRSCSSASELDIHIT